jgi:3-isopropylmalate/(R)-2-methylmalate dehydratase large subunit
MKKKPKTLLDKVWDNHIVIKESGAPAVLYIDLHLVHELTSPQAFNGLRARGLKVRRPDRTYATMDHSTPTIALSLQYVDKLAAHQLQLLESNCQEFGIPIYNLDDPHRGIVHIIGPELGLTQPGMTIVCGDSHTATHGAFGALAFGIGTSEVEHVLATQCILQSRPQNCLIEFNGTLSSHVTAKDMILFLISTIGIGGGTGYVFEYSGSTIKSLNMEARMTLCNMSIEAGTRAGMIEPDDITFEYLANRPFAPQGDKWDIALRYWRTLPSDNSAEYDQVISLDVGRLEPMITYGTNPSMAIPISQPVPDPRSEKNANRRAALEKAMSYMDIEPGRPLLGHPVNVVFIGSCTNGRISDLRQAASLLKGRKISENVKLLVVPGSESVRRMAEEEGLDRIFKEAGADWRYSGCSMCVAINGDQLHPGQYAVSTSNRNFEGRQGPGGRTFLASPLTAAATAISGHITNPKHYKN